MAITKTKLLIEISQNINTIATAVQLDGNSRFLDVSLHDKGLPIDLTGHVVRIHVSKPDGKTVFNQGEITDATAGRCQFALTAEMLSEAKELKAQISIWNSDTEILSTKVFKILVTESLRNDEEVEASNEFGVLVVLFTEIQSALELMRELVSAFGEPGEMAAAYGVDTFWAMLEHLAAGADVRQVLKENINSTMDTEGFATLDELILRAVDPHGVQEFTSSGTFVVPEGVHKILVTACGGGGGGSGNYIAGGGGGGGGACIRRQPYSVTPGQSIDITIGTGGAGGSGNKNASSTYNMSSGSTGGSTVIGSLITLPGGTGGVVVDKATPYKGGAGGAGGGQYSSGGGGGGTAESNNHALSVAGTGYVNGERGTQSADRDAIGGKGGDNALFGTLGGAGGTYYNDFCGGGGGGAAYGAGGAGGKGNTAGSVGGYGAGGGGAGGGDRTSPKSGGAGGAGIVIIEW